MVKRRVRILKNIDNIDNNTMIEWMWICWGKTINYLNVHSMVEETRKSGENHRPVASH
jgi:hypothetical protein